MKRIVLCLPVLALCLACSAGRPSNDDIMLGGMAVAAQTGAGLAPGDIVRITVWRQPELSGEFTVAADGTVRHPLYKEVTVSGMPIAQAEQRIFDFLTRYEQNPQVVMEPLFRVSVGGEVTSPSLYSLPRETTIAQAVATAGGPTEEGQLKRVRILRDGREVYADLTTPDAEWARQLVQSGDQILVTRKRNILYEVIGPVASLTGAIAGIVAVLQQR